MFIKFLQFAIFFQLLAEMMISLPIQASKFRVTGHRRGDALPHSDGRGLEQDNARLHDTATILHAGRQLLGDGLRQLPRFPDLFLYFLRHHYLHRPESFSGYVCDALSRTRGASCSSSITVKIIIL